MNLSKSCFSPICATGYCLLISLLPWGMKVGVFGHHISSLNSPLCIWVFISIYVLSVAMSGMFSIPFARLSHFSLTRSPTQHSARLPLNLSWKQSCRGLLRSHSMPHILGAESQAMRGPSTLKNSTHFPEFIPPKRDFLKKGQHRQSKVWIETRASPVFLFPAIFPLQCI